MRFEFEEKQAELKAQFESKIEEIKRKSAEELNHTKAEMIAKLKRDYGERRHIFLATQFEIANYSIFLNITHFFFVSM